LSKESSEPESELFSKRGLTLATYYRVMEAGSDPGKLLFLHPMMLKIRDEMGLECAFGGLKAAFKN
jgi:hypothetical protein